MKRFIATAGMITVLLASTVQAQQVKTVKISCSNKAGDIVCSQSGSYMDNFLKNGWLKYINSNKDSSSKNLQSNNQCCQNSSDNKSEENKAQSGETTASPTNQTPSGGSQNNQADQSSQSQLMQQQVVDLVNQYRAQYGLKPLKINSDVSRVAQAKSEDMKNKNYFNHTSPTYGSPFNMLKSFGISYKTAGENIAKGQKTAQAVVNAWMNSEGHRANILNANFEEIGVGYAKSGTTTYWTQLFIKK